MVSLEATHRRAAPSARYGRAALRQVVEIVRNAGATELLTSYTTGEGEPWPFYEHLGFAPTVERDVAGEVILSLDLSRG